MGLKILIVSFISLFAFEVSAQGDSLILTKNYQFNDGVYLSFEAFL